MINNINTDITKELNLKSIQSSLNKKLDKNAKLKNFEDTFNKKLSNNLDNKKEDRVDSNEDKVDSNYKKDNNKNDYSKKLDKLKSRLEKLSKKVDNEDETADSKEQVSSTVDELLAMLNDLISQLDVKDDNSNLTKDEEGMSGIIDGKNSTLIDMLNTKKSDIGSQLKEIVKLLEPMKTDEASLDLNNIKSMIDDIDKLMEQNGKKSNPLENNDFKTNVINELKVALSNTSKEKENTNNAYKESINADDKNINVDNIKIANENKSANSNDTFKGSDGNNKNSTTSEDKTIKKEDSFLDSLVNDKDKNSINRFMPGNISKLNTFEATLEKVNETSQSVNKTNVVDGIVKNIKFMQTKDLKELTVSMNPKDLGNLVIKISVEDGKLNAKIIAEKKETFDLINSNATDVKSALGTVNDRVQEVSVNIQFGDATAYEQFKEGPGYQNNERRYNNDSSNIVAEENISEDKTEDDLYGDSVVNMLA